MVETLDINQREARTWGVAAHVSAIVGGFVLPFGNIIGPARRVPFESRPANVCDRSRKSVDQLQITVTIAAFLFVVDDSDKTLPIPPAAFTVSGRDRVS